MSSKKCNIVFSAILVSSIILLSLISINCSKQPTEIVRPAHFGYKLPYPQPDRLLQVDTTVNRQPDVSIRRLIFLIDTLGSLKSYSQVDGDEPLFDSIYHDKIHALKFIPGMKDSSVVALKIVVSAMIEGMGGELHINFPVEADKSVFHNDLYWKSIELNKIELPTITRFESYSFDIKRYDNHKFAPFKIYRIWLDSEGKVESLKYHGGSYEPFTAQIAAAINWSSYSPLKIDGEAVRFSGYIVFLFYPGIENPTPVLSSDSIIHLSLLERVRVKIFPDTLGLINSPVPVLAWNGDFSTVKDNVPLVNQKWSAWLAIDTIGKAKVKSSSYIRRQARKAFVRVAYNERFYPAMDFSGRSIAYDGLAYIRFKSDTTIRIRFGWLPEPSIEKSP